MPLIRKNRIGNLKISVDDPDGHTIEIVQYMPATWTDQDIGKHLPLTRISDQMMYAGILVGNMQATAAFSGGIIGCYEPGVVTASPAQP